MAFWDKLKKELIDIIEWVDADSDVMVSKFQRYDNEIKNGAQLIVRESQAAIFIDQGQIADIFGPGTYELKTENLPVLSKLKGWKYGFESPFKAEVYFVATKKFTNRKWGTPNAFYIRDQDFGRVSLRAFGTYTIRVSDPARFLKDIVGTTEEFSTDEITNELRSMIITRFIDSIGESKLSLLDFAQNYKDLSDFCGDKLQNEFPEYGLEITKFLISSISLPEKLQEKLDEGTGMNMIGDMNRYSQMKAADAMEGAANNPASGGGMEGMMGMAMMQQMMNQNNMQQQQRMQSQQQTSAPPPPPPPVQFFVSVNGQQQGPFDFPALQNLIASGQLSHDTFVWKQGMSGWQKAGEVPDLGGLFSMAPPPPPPPPM